jgi:hypothetical protein
MNSLVNNIFGLYIIEQLERLKRVLVCTMGAIYLNNQNALHIYLKTLYIFCRCKVDEFASCLYRIRAITRGLHRGFVELYVIQRPEDVFSRTNADLNSHLLHFFHHIENVLFGHIADEIVRTFVVVIRFTILTWKYVELCLPLNVMDESIRALEDLSEITIQQTYEFRFMTRFML